MSLELIRPGSTLVTNTMICQAARFVAEPAAVLGMKIDAFFDLCTLVEAVVLRNKLYTMEGDLVGYSSNCHTLPLVSALIQEGILCPGKIPIDPDSIKRAIISIVGSRRAFEPINIDGFNFSVANLIPGVFPDESDPLIAASNFPEGDRRSFMMLMTHREAPAIFHRRTTAFEFFHGDGFLALLRGTGDTQRGGYALRTFLYSQSAQNVRICFMPDYARIPILESVLNTLYKNIVIEGCAQFSRKLECEAEDFLLDASPLGLPLPPFTSLLLDRCRKAGDLVHVLLDMRSEFRNLRENVTEFEESLMSSSSIKDRNKIRRRVTLAFESLAKKYNSDHMTTLKKAIDFAGDVTQAAYNWTNPTAYNASLLTEPIEWFTNWWHRRPLVQFFDVAKEFRAIEKYNLLVDKVFGVRFSNGEIEKFKRAKEVLSTSFSVEDGT